MAQPLVSVITATYRRGDLLTTRCAPSVDRQTYRPLEHIIVADGHDDGWRACEAGTSVDRRYVDLGRNWRSFTSGLSYGAIPRLAGTLLARGEYIAYLDDDDAYRPDHVAALMRLLADTGTDFVFSRMRWADGTVIGNGQPEVNHIGTPMLLHRAELLTVANWRPAGYADDWDLVQRWLAAGATWAALDSVTVDVWPGGQA